MVSGVRVWVVRHSEGERRLGGTAGEGKIVAGRATGKKERLARECWCMFSYTMRSGRWRNDVKEGYGHEESTDGRSSPVGLGVGCNIRERRVYRMRG